MVLCVSFALALGKISPAFTLPDKSCFFCSSPRPFFFVCLGVVASPRKARTELGFGALSFLAALTLGALGRGFFFFHHNKILNLDLQDS